MEWLAQWVKNLAFYYIFLSALMHLIPGGEERKYIRFFMGMMLLLFFLKPLLQMGEWDEQLEQAVLTHSLEEEFEEMMRETGRQELAGVEYVKNACEKEMKRQVKQLLQEWGYSVISCEISFFDGELLELREISLKVKGKGEDTQKEEKFLKSKLEEVYNIPEGNINISIQG